jgi:hypothetical protein
LPSSLSAARVSASSASRPRRSSAPPWRREGVEVALHRRGVGRSTGGRFAASSSASVLVDADDDLLAGLDAALEAHRRRADHPLHEAASTALYMPPASSIVFMIATIFSSIWSVSDST